MRDADVMQMMLVEYLARRASVVGTPAPRADQPLTEWFAARPEEQVKFTDFLEREFKFKLTDEQKRIICRGSAEDAIFYLQRVLPKGGYR